MIAFDTNVLVRLLADDHAAQRARAHSAVVAAKALNEAIFINDVVLAETLRTMGRSYRSSRSELAEMAQAFYDSADFSFESRGTVGRALALFKSSSADFSDCLIVAKNAAAGCRATLTFDADCLRLPSAAPV